MKSDTVCVAAEPAARAEDLRGVFDEVGLTPEIVAPADAEHAAPGRFAVLWIMAGPDPHPGLMTAEMQKTVRAFHAAGRGVYAEFIAGFPGVADGGRLRKAGPARMVIAESLGGAGALTKDTILDAHDALTIDAAPAGARVCAEFGKVRGVDRVLTPAPAPWPAILSGEQGPGRWAWAALRMSDFGRRQFSPHASWFALVRDLARWLLPAQSRERLEGSRIPLKGRTEPRAWAVPGSFQVIIETATGATVSSKGLAFTESGPGRFCAEVALRREGTARFEVQVSRGDRKRKVGVETRVEERRAAYRGALDRNIAWFERSGALLSPDGSLGVAEWISGPDGEGNRIPYGKGQLFAPIRADCAFESGLAFLRYGAIASDPKRDLIGRNVLARVLDFQRLEGEDELAGLWYTRGRAGPPYEDDQAWAVICALAAYRETRKPMFLDRGLLAARKTLEVFGAGSPRSAAPADPDHEHPHDRGQMFAAWLYTYGVTGERQFLSKATRGIRDMKATFRALPKFLISRTGEESRWLLPLALAFAYTGDEVFSRELADTAAYLRSRRAPCGAIQEEGGNAGDRLDGTDLGLTYEGTETISDQLYTTSWAAMNLWIAHCATGLPEYRDDFERLVDYLVRIQLRSGDPRVDGGWTRGFDYEKWESHGSNADHSWTAWCLETGWTNAIIDIALAMYLDGDCFYEKRPPS